VLAAQEPARLVSLMAANNESGVIQPGPRRRRTSCIATAVCCTSMPCRRGTDAGRIMALGADLMTLSAHKLGGS